MTIRLIGVMRPTVRLTGRVGRFIVPPDPIYTTLLGWWQLEEASGQMRLDSHDGLHAEETPVAVGQAAGKHGNAASFDGTAYLRVPTTEALQGWSSDSVSWSGALWFYPTRSFPEGLIALYDSGASGSNRSWMLYLQNLGVHLLSFRTVSSSDLVYTETAATLNAWNLATFRYNHATRKIGVSLNGGVWVEASIADDMRLGAYPLIIGSFNNQVTSQTFQGRIDSAALWRDYALTDDDLAWLWNGGAGRTYAEFTAQYGGSG